MKKVIMILLPLLLIGVGVVSAAFFGVINIPGISPKKKIAKAKTNYTEGTDKIALNIPKEESKKPEPSKKPSKPAEINLKKGRQKLAVLWNEMPTEALVKIIEDWKDEDLAAQFAYMDEAKVSQVLAGLEAKRASKVSQKLQEIVAKGTF